MMIFLVTELFACAAENVTCLAWGTNDQFD